jgi:hypothetical protein
MPEKKYKIVESSDGKTLDEMAQIGAKNLRDKPLAKIVIKALLGGEDK